MTARPSHPDPTPEQAAEQLRAARRGGQLLREDGDRARHAVATAGCSLALGLTFSVQNLVSGAGHFGRSAIFLAVWLGACAWLERSTRTVPRGALRWSRIGIAGSLALALFAVLPYLNLQEQDEPNTWMAAAIGGLVIAVPGLLAAARIARSAR